MAERIGEVAAGSLHLRWMRVDVENVVTLHVSWPVPLADTAREELLDHLAVGLLDHGAGTWDEEAAATYLEDRGVELRFSVADGWVRCQVRMLAKYVSDVLQLLVACMRDPRMDDGSFVTVSARLRSNLMQARSRTSSLAMTGMRQCIFAPGHPEYAWGADERLRALETITSDAVRDHYQARLLPTQIRVAVVGDLDENRVRLVTSGLSGGVPSGTSHPELARSDWLHNVPRLLERAPERLHVPLADRSNLDVRMGHGIDLLRSHEAYDALKTGIFALGGNFSARLMNTVRDRDGLTYGIGSSLSGVGVDWPGMWVTSLSLSASVLEKGIDATRTEISLFIQNGITDDERRAVVGTLTGSSQVQLGTTMGLAQVMLRHMERGEPATEMDAWAQRIERLTTRQINDAIGTWLDADRLHVVSAGTAPPETALGPVSDPA